MRDRQRGCLIGLAVGDALGAAVEFSPPGTFEPVAEYRSGGPFNLAPGAWTDDTSMALALADSIASVGWDLNDQATRYCAWWREGKYSVVDRCFDIGNTTRQGLRRFETTGNARTSGETGNSASGNGSIMRLAPVPIRFAEWYPDRIGELALRGEESSLPTHGSLACRSACHYLSVVLAALIRGEPREVVLGPDWIGLREMQACEPLDHRILEVAAGSFREKEPPGIRGSGYVVESLEAALWAFHRASSFEQAVLRAVNLGDDADTTGAICGQLAGAYWGESGIPENLRTGLVRSEWIDRASERLLKQ